WDFAATERKQKGDDPDYTVGLRLKRHRGIYYIEDVQRVQATPAEVDRLVKNTALQDGAGVYIGWEIEPGSSGKKVNQQLVQMLAGYVCRGVHPAGDKLQRAKPAAAQALAGNVKVVRGVWVGDFLSEVHGFPDLPHDDQVDALSGAFNLLQEIEPGGAESRIVSRSELATLFG
ncbi:MAG TPA: phage terminase large subunit, partial [Caldilineaceae bacterium]|nr:phage terminase large subunit [Caldilineaceae bacterium]